MRYFIYIIAILLAMRAEAHAQFLIDHANTPTPNPVYVPLGQPYPPAPLAGGSCTLTFCVQPGLGGITLGQFANLAAMNAQFAALNVKIDGGFAATAMAQSQLTIVNSQIASMNREVSRSLEIGAVAAAMKDAIPNTGDRFAIRLNAAGFEGYAAGAIGVSWNVTDSARLSLNYGQGRSQGIVSGGLNLSFR